MVKKLNNSYFEMYGDRAKDRRHKSKCRFYKNKGCLLKSNGCNSSSLCPDYTEDNLYCNTKRKSRYIDSSCREVRAKRELKIKYVAVYCMMSEKSKEVHKFYVSDIECNIGSATQVYSDCTMAKKLSTLEKGDFIEINGVKNKLIGIEKIFYK